MAIRLGTSEYGGTFYTQGHAIAELFNRGRAEVGTMRRANHRREHS